MTVPNQNIMIIHRIYPKANFLQISNEHWQNVLKETDPYTLALYLYFASNANNYKLEVSPAAIYNAIGLPRSTYYKKLDVLKKQGYIVQKQGNVYDFYEVPIGKKVDCGGLSGGMENLQNEHPRPQNELENLLQKQNCFSDNIEINKNTIHNTDKMKNANNSTTQKPVFIF